ncbi:unnamed protein product, partial [Closterium sp. NIES-54]
RSTGTLPCSCPARTACTHAAYARCAPCLHAAPTARALPALLVRCICCSHASRPTRELPVRCLHLRCPACIPHDLPAPCPHAAGAARELPLRPSRAALPEPRRAAKPSRATLLKCPAEPPCIAAQPSCPCCRKCMAREQRLTVSLLEKHLLKAETSTVAVAASRGTPRSPFFKGCSPSLLVPFVVTAPAAAVDFLHTEEVGAASAPSGRCHAARARGVKVVGVAGGGGGDVVAVVVAGVEEVVVEAVVAAVEVMGVVEVVEWAKGARVAVGVELAGAEAMGWRLGVQLMAAEALGMDTNSSHASRSHAPLRSFVSGLSSVAPLGVVSIARTSGARALGLDIPNNLAPIGKGVDVFALNFDKINTKIYAIYARPVSVESDCYSCVPCAAGVEAAALGACESAATGTASAEALHTFTLDSGASRCCFHDCTTAQRSQHLSQWLRQVTWLRQVRRLHRRAAPHSSSSLPTTASQQTLHMDVWGPARVCGQDQERYFLLQRSGLHLLLVGGAATARARGARVVEGTVGAAVEAVEEAEGVAVEVGVVAGVGASVAAVGVVEAAAAVVEAATAVVEVAAVVVLVAVELRSVEALVVASASSSYVPVRPRRPSSFVSGTLGVGGLGVLVLALTFFAPTGAVGRRADCHTLRSAASVA